MGVSLSILSSSNHHDPSKPRQYQRVSARYSVSMNLISTVRIYSLTSWLLLQAPQLAQKCMVVQASLTLQLDDTHAQIFALVWQHLVSLQPPKKRV